MRESLGVLDLTVLRSVRRREISINTEVLRSSLRRLGPRPSRRLWKSTRSTNYDERRRARNAVMEYQHAFWRVTSEVIDSQA